MEKMKKRYTKINFKKRFALRNRGTLWRGQPKCKTWRYARQRKAGNRE
jgi:hypothetical protein